MLYQKVAVLSEVMLQGLKAIGEATSENGTKWRGRKYQWHARMKLPTGTEAKQNV
jgi:hypothetical protein